MSDHIFEALSLRGGSVSRWRGEQRGVLEQRATGWFGRWREYVQREDGQIVWQQVTRKLGDAEMTRGEAQIELNRRLAHANGPARVEANLATVQQFVDVRFRPDHINALKPATQAQYESLLKNHILPAIGGQNKAREALL